MSNLVRYFFRKLGANFVNFSLDYPGENLTLSGTDVIVLGTTGVDRVYVKKGIKFNFSNSGAGTDEIYLEGSFADYSLTARGTSSLVLTSHSKANTQISLASEDKVIFKDGSILVASLLIYVLERDANQNNSADPAPTQPILRTSESSQTLPSTINADGSSKLNSILRAYTKDPHGVVFAQPAAGVDFYVTGHNGVDRVYVVKGGVVNANNLGGSVDLVYVTGYKNDYTATVFGSSVLVLTKGTERVTLSSEDRVIFADGGSLVKAAITAAASTATWTALTLDSSTRTPGFGLQLSLKSGQGTYVNSIETGVDVELVSKSLAANDTIQLMLGTESLGSVHTVTSVEASLNKASINITRNNLGNTDGIKNITAVVTHNDTVSASNTLGLTLDAQAPAAPVVALIAGVNGVLIFAEAIVATGVVSVVAESYSVVAVTFSDGYRSVSKTVTGAGTATTKMVTLNAADIGTGVAQLHDGTIRVSATATDAAGNTSNAGAVSFKLDTTPPAIRTSLNVKENVRVVGSAAINVEDVVTWAINGSSGDNLMFDIDARTGAISWKSVRGIDFESESKSAAGSNAYKITVSAIDTEGNRNIQTITIHLLDVNEAPLIWTGYVHTVNEDTPLPISDFWVIDQDAGANGIVTVQVRVEHGRLGVKADLAGGLTASSIQGNDSVILTLTDKPEAIQTTLASLVYSPNTNYNGSDTLYLRTLDGGGLWSDYWGIITVKPVNDAPSISGIPRNAQSIATQVPSQLAEFSVADGDSSTLFVTLKTSNGTLGGLSAGTNNGLTTQIDNESVQLSGTAQFINSALAAATFTASTDGAASIAVTVSDVAWSDSSSAVTAGYSLKASTAPSLNLNGSQDAYVNSSQSSVSLELSFAGWAQGDSVQLSLAGSKLGNAYSITANDASAYKASISIARSLLGSDGSKSIGAVLTHSGRALAQSNPLVLTVDTQAPAVPVLEWWSGVSGGVTAVEAIDTSGVVSVKAESASLVTVSFSDGRRSISKTVIGAGPDDAVAVRLNAEDIGTGKTQLHDGTILVSVSASDAAGNISNAATGSFALDTKLPSIRGRFIAKENSLAAGSAAINGDDAVHWAIEGSSWDNLLFDIDARTGAISWKSANGRDFESETKSAIGSNDYMLGVSASDTAGNKDIQTISINLLDMNDAPRVWVLKPYTVNEDAPLSIGDFTVSDQDVGVNGLVSVQVSVGHGRLVAKADLNAGLTASGIQGSATGILVLTGKPDAIQTTLASLVYSANTNYNGSDTMRVRASDGGGLWDEYSGTITVTPVNDIPGISGIPRSIQSLATQVPSPLADFSVVDVDSSTLFVSLVPSNGTLGGFSAGTANGLTTQINGASVQLSGTAQSINTALAAGTFTASTDGAASIAVTVSDIAWSDSSSVATASYILSASNLPTLSLGNAQDAYVNSSGSSVSVDLCYAGLAQGDSVQLQLAGSYLATAYSITANDASTHIASISIARSLLGSDGPKSISAVLTHGDKPLAETNALVLTLDSQAPAAPVLVFGKGVSGGATAVEALSTTGVVCVKAESSSVVVVTFSDGNCNISKTVTGSGIDNVVAVKLDAADIGTWVAQLHDGSIRVSATATDAAGNASILATGSFNLDTLAPSIRSSLRVNENTNAVGSAAINDNEAVTWAIEGSGADNLLFNMDARTAAISWKSSVGYDYEWSKSAAGSNDEYLLIASATDSAGNKSIQTITVNLIDVNDAPNVYISSLTVNEDTALTIPYIYLNDQDAGANNIVLVQVSVEQGRLVVSADLDDGLTASGIQGNATGILILTGSADAIQTTLASLVYNAPTNYNGSDKLRVRACDGGGLWGEYSGAITVTKVNDAPSISGIPRGSQSISTHVATQLADFSVADVDSSIFFVTLAPSNGRLGGFSAGAVNDLTTQINGAHVQLSGTAQSINIALAAGTFTASADGAASIAVTVSDIAWSDSSSVATASYSLNAGNVPTLSLGNTQDAYVNSSESSVNVELSYAGLAEGDSVQLQLGGSKLGNAYSITANDASTHIASISMARSLLGSDGPKSISAVLTHGDKPLAETNALVLTLDSQAPAAPVLVFGKGVSGGATATEASDNSGVVWIKAEKSSEVTVRFSDGSRSISKIMTGAGTDDAVAITLAATDIGTGIAQLHDGIIQVTATARDAAGNTSAATGSFTLDTLAPDALWTEYSLMEGSLPTGTMQEVELFFVDANQSINYLGLAGRYADFFHLSSDGHLILKHAANMDLPAKLDLLVHMADQAGNEAFRTVTVNLVNENPLNLLTIDMVGLRQNTTGEWVEIPGNQLTTGNKLHVSFHFSQPLSLNTNSKLSDNLNGAFQHSPVFGPSTVHYFDLDINAGKPEDISQLNNLKGSFDFVDYDNNHYYVNNLNFADLSQWRIIPGYKQIAGLPIEIKALLFSNRDFSNRYWTDTMPSDLYTEMSYTFLGDFPSYWTDQSKLYYVATEKVAKFVPFTDRQQTTVRQILTEISNFSMLKFVEMEKPEYANISFGNHTHMDAGGYSEDPYGAGQGKDGTHIWITASHINPTISSGDANWDRQVIVHELGHSLGLKHPFEGDYVLPNELDTSLHTQMSYFDPQDENANYFYAAGMMPLDVQALQFLYGTNNSYHTGNDIYKLDYSEGIVATLWDANGLDTISAQGQNIACTINLNPGEFCSFSNAGRNPKDINYHITRLGIAYAAAIENAAGGTGDDTLIGNTLDNTLAGGSGADTFEFTGNWGNDTITDFEPGSDHISFKSDNSVHWSDLSQTATLDHLLIAVHGQTIFLNGITTALTASNFVFAV